MRIRQKVVPRDLFGDVARGVSIPKIIWEIYFQIVQLVVATFGKSLQRVTLKVLTESYGTMSMVAKKTNLLTVLVKEIYEKDVVFSLCFDDLEGTNAERNKVLEEIVRRARLGPILHVESGELIGCVTMERLINIVPFPDKDTSERFPWKKSGFNVNAEISSLSARRALKS
ncbi:MAG: hypothetical protein Q7R59_01765 [bacterium]|nr:hypothetical protein [bacterium]